MFQKPRSILPIIPALLLAAGLGFSFFTLTTFPAIHSDEVWLADLSREIAVSKNPAATESFFRITPRYPHAIKTLYHLIQGFFLRFSYTPLAARLPSYLASLLALAAAAWAAQKNSALSRLWIAVPLFLLWNLQFLYASHFGRQEIFIVTIFMGGYAVLKSSKPGVKQGVVLGLITAPGLFIHPNIFIIALALGFIMVYRDLRSENDIPIPVRRKVSGWFVYAVLLAAAAAAVLVLSFRWDPDFLTHYRNFGDNHGVGMPLLLKLRRLPRFFYKMYIQAAGTYYLPPVKGVILAGTAGLILRPVMGFLTRTPRPLETTVGTLGLAAGLVVIGKYSPPSLVFFFPLAAFALVENLVLAGKLLRRAGLPTPWNKFPLLIGIILLLAQAGSTITEALRFQEVSREYRQYEQFLSEAVPPGREVLANLNTGFILDTKRLHPYRDLAFLEERGITVTDYLKQANIEWVVWPEEMEIIYAERPVWNDLYGNLYPYYDELTALLKASQAVSQGSFPVYGMRIIPYQGRRGGTITVYRIILP